MAIEGWGLDQWGLEEYGSTTPLPPLAIDAALAISTKEVQVTLNREPQSLAPTVVGDALNPATWIIQRLDNAFIFSTLSVRKEDPLTFVVSVLEDFGPFTATHRILSVTLLDADGGAISNPPLNRADFAGVLSAETKDEVTRARLRSNAIRDVANPPLPATGTGTTVGGTLVINNAGDYDLESGAPLLRKLIIRRLITLKGGFFHLPDYGLGLGVKETLPAANLIKLRAEAIRQIKREPEVEETDVQLTLSVKNELTVRVRAKTRTGEGVDFSFTPRSEGIVL